MTVSDVSVYKTHKPLRSMTVTQRLMAYNQYKDAGGTWEYSVFLAYMWDGYFNIETGLPIMMTLEDEDALDD